MAHVHVSRASQDLLVSENKTALERLVPGNREELVEGGRLRLKHGEQGGGRKENWLWVKKIGGRCTTHFSLF